MAATETVNVNQDGQMFISNNQLLAEFWNNGINVNETGKWIIIEPNDLNGG